MRALRITACAFALAALLTPAALAQSNEYSKLTYLTFSGPVQVPGATLPAGTYTFKMADPSAHVVRVLSRDGKRVFTTFFALPMERLETPHDTIVMFAERPAGVPQAVKVWYYPGNSTGEEFVYPKHQAVEIAKANHTTVLSSDSNVNDKNATIARVDENGQATVSKAPVATVAEARPQEPAPSAIGTAGNPSQPASLPAKLPQTGSDLGLMALASALSLAGAFGTRRVRTHLTAGN